MGWERCRQVPCGKQGGQDLWIMHSMWSRQLVRPRHGVCSLLPGGTIVGGWGSCRRLEWETVRGQRVQICGELVWVSSTALFITLSCRRGREGALMLLCGAGKNAVRGFWDLLEGGVGLFQWLQTIHKDNRVELRLCEEFVCCSRGLPRL